MYDPVTARFLQEDTYKGDPNDPLSLNLYTYCTNNPIIYDDPTGHWLHIVAGAFFGGIIGGAMDIGSQMLFEHKSFSEIKWKSVWLSAAEGAISGALGAATGGASLLAAAGKETIKVTGKQVVKQVAKTAITEAIIGGTSNAIAQGIVNREIDWKQVGFSALIDGVTGGVGSGVANSKIGKKLFEVQDKAIGFIKDKVNTISRNINFPKLATPEGMVFGNINDNIGKVNMPKVEQTPVQKNFLEATRNAGSDAGRDIDNLVEGLGNGKKTNYEGYVKSGKGQPPQNFSPVGAGKNGAFREAKRASGVPVSQQPSKIVDPGIGKNGKPVVGGGKDYYFKDSNGNEVVIRQHNEHIYEDDPIQNRGTHFNDKYGNHYDYEK